MEKNLYKNSSVKLYIYIYIEEKSAVGQELDFGLVSIRVEKRRGKNIEKALPS